MSISDYLNSMGIDQISPKHRTGPVWAGPQEDGITFSLLNRYLCDIERFRIYTMKGLAPMDGFNHRLEYGNMWHICEESHAAKEDTGHWEKRLRAYCQGLARRYKTAQDDIDKWFNVCRTQFPQYVEFWAKNEQKIQRKPVYQEYSFTIPYTLPSGRIALLRGKWDSVDLIGTGRDAGIFLQENKTKGDIWELGLTQQLTFDMQTMFYVVALVHHYNNDDGIPNCNHVKGVRYNVVRRPLSGGKHTIVRLKPTKRMPRGETKESFYARLGTRIKEDAKYFFMRWNVGITPEDIYKFKHECLNPVLENLLDDYEWWARCTQVEPDGLHLDPFAYEARGWMFPHHRRRHFRFPYGIYNVLTEGGQSDLDNYLMTGSEVGLRRVDNLFPELS